ncbi:MAG: hypothetical protein WA921_07060 [Ahrensia sp.]
MRNSFIVGAAFAVASLFALPASAAPLATAAPSVPVTTDVQLVASGGVSGSAKRRYYVEKSYDHDHRSGKHTGKYADKRYGYDKKTTGRTIYKGFGPKQGDYRFSYTGRVGGVVPRSSTGSAPKVRHTKPRIIQLR